MDGGIKSGVGGRRSDVGRGGRRTLGVMAAERWTGDGRRETLSRLVGGRVSDVGRKWIGRDILPLLILASSSILSVYRLPSSVKHSLRTGDA